MKAVKLANIEFSNEKPMVFIGGINVLESRDLAMRVADVMTREAARHQMPYVFKASFDKANRSSIRSFSGPGIEEGMRILQDVRDSFDVPILTDIHLAEQAAVAAEVCDILQLPAFLARQTDLITALAKTGKVANVKKPQFMSPRQIGNVVDKFVDLGNNQVLICERGSCFGYDNLVVDMLGFSVMKEVGGDAGQKAQADNGNRCLNSPVLDWLWDWREYSWRHIPTRIALYATDLAPYR